MDASVIDCAVKQLRASGAEFAYLHGSRASGNARPDSDFDVAAYFANPVPASFEVDVPTEIDLLILNDAPLEIAGRIALDGRLLFDDNPVDRVHWESRTRKVYSDEKYRIDRSHREFLEEATRGR
ncbi:MAG: nucleotidyltransferase domain-containing protein [Actinobacteria bacterium]|nr:nucleotidyltransferase domain-containing protein [Actinomycetota bacterium]